MRPLLIVAFLVTQLIATFPTSLFNIQCKGTGQYLQTLQGDQDNTPASFGSYNYLFSRARQQFFTDGTDLVVRVGLLKILALSDTRCVVFLSEATNETSSFEILSTGQIRDKRSGYCLASQAGGSAAIIICNPKDDNQLFLFRSVTTGENLNPKDIKTEMEQRGNKDCPSVDSRETGQNLNTFKIMQTTTIVREDEGQYMDEKKVPEEKNRFALKCCE